LFIFLTQNICIFFPRVVIFADNNNERYPYAQRTQDIGVLWHFAYDRKNFIHEMYKLSLSFQCFWRRRLYRFHQMNWMLFCRIM